MARYLGSVWQRHAETMVGELLERMEDYRHKSEHWQQRREDLKVAFLFHNCLQNVCLLRATEENVPWSCARPLLSASRPLLRNRSAITEHTSKFCDGPAPYDWVFVITTKETDWKHQYPQITLTVRKLIPTQHVENVNLLNIFSNNALNFLQRMSNNKEGFITIRKNKSYFIY